MNTADLVISNALTEICAYRDAALTKMTEALDLMSLGQKLASEAASLALQAHKGVRFHLADRSKSDDYLRIFQEINAERCQEVYRQQLGWPETLDKKLDRVSKQRIPRNVSVSGEQARLILNHCGDEGNGWFLHRGKQIVIHDCTIYHLC